MELHRLRLLLELHRLGTVAAVAEALACSPSSVSVQLGQLEREAGVRLLRRSGRLLAFTAAGERLAEYAAKALADDEVVRAELASLQERPTGRLRVTVVQTPALALLPGMLDVLERDAPEVAVEVVQRETGPALEDLRARVVDLVVGIEYDPLPVPRHRGVERVDLLREDVLLALPAQHPLAAGSGPVRLTACDGQVWASGHAGTGLDALVRNVGNRIGGFEPDVRHRSDDGLVLAALVAAGRAVTLLPALLAPAAQDVSFHPVAEERLQRTVFAAFRSSTRDAPAVVAAQHALRRSAASLERRGS